MPRPVSETAISTPGAPLSRRHAFAPTSTRPPRGAAWRPFRTRFRRTRLAEGQAAHVGDRARWVRPAGRRLPLRARAEHVLEEPAAACRFRLDDREGVGPELLARPREEELRVPADAGQDVAQVVGDARGPRADRALRPRVFAPSHFAPPGALRSQRRRPGERALCALRAEFPVNPQVVTG